MCVYCHMSKKSRFNRYYLSKLRVKEVEKLRNSHKTASKTNDGLPEISKMKYRNRIQEQLFPVLSIVKKIKN
jgi:hypothetical protein